MCERNIYVYFTIHILYFLSKGLAYANCTSRLLEINASVVRLLSPANQMQCVHRIATPRAWCREEHSGQRQGCGELAKPHRTTGSGRWALRAGASSQVRAPPSDAALLRPAASPCRRDLGCPWGAGTSERILRLCLCPPVPRPRGFVRWGHRLCLSLG